MNTRSITIRALLAFGLVLFSSQVAMAAPAPKKTSTLTGIDVSYPQCQEKLPTNHAFGIVGVNGGKATTGNPCLSQQLSWAHKAVGGTKQDKVQLYVNTANPGGLETPSWPQDNIDPSGSFVVVNPHGFCYGDDSVACAWQYGWNRAQEDVVTWFGTSAKQANVDTNPSSYVWWLDVELENSWKLGKSDFDYASNIAVLEGMTEYLTTNKLRVGLYSTGYQWGEVTGGKITSQSNLNSKPNWRPGGFNQATAKQACTATPLTDGGSVVLAQYISRGLDYNISCIE